METLNVELEFKEKEKEKTRARHFVRRKDLIAQSLEGELVMLDMQSGNYFGLDPIASKIWDYLASPKDIKTLCQSLMQEYEVGEDECQADVCSFISDLLDKGMVVTCP